MLSPLHQSYSLNLPVEIKTVSCKSVCMDDTLSGTESKQTAKDNSQDEFDQVEVETIEGKASQGHNRVEMILWSFMRTSL